MVGIRGLLIMARYCRSWLVLVAAVLLPGCVFHRTLTNERLLNADLSFLQPGKTKLLEAVKELGVPMPFEGAGTFEVRLSERQLLYVCRDIRCVEFQPAYFLALPFLWCDDQIRWELLLEFDDQGVLKSAWTSESQSVWRPFAGDESRPAPKVSCKTAEVRS